MLLDSTQIDSVVVVRMHATSLDAGNAQEFKLALQPFVQRYVHLVLDLGNVQFVDSTGIGILVSSLRQVQAAQGDIKLSSLTKPVRALFQLVRLHRVVEVFNTPAEAIASFRLPRI